MKEGEKTMDDALHRSINACRHCVEPCAIPFEEAVLSTIVTSSTIANSNGFPPPSLLHAKTTQKRVDFY